MGWYYYDDEYPYEEPPEPRPIPGAIRLTGPIEAKSRRGPIGVEWWGQQWVAAIDRVRGDARLDRGKRYARNGSVQDMEIAHGQAFSHVRGSRGRRYHTYVRLKPFTDAEWERAIQALAEQAIYAAKLLAGEMPGNIEAIFAGMGTSLFPRSRKDIQFDCSCPDWGDPCKHGAAVYYLLAEQFDSDPFILFHLRGHSREDVLNQLRALRGDVTESAEETATSDVEGVSLADELGDFWRGSETILVRAVPVRGETPFVFRQLGNPPGNVHRDLNKLYQAIADEAIRWLGLDDKE